MSSHRAVAAKVPLVRTLCYRFVELCHTAQNSAVTQAGLCAHERLFMENHTDPLSKDGSKGTKAKMVDLEERSMEADEI